MNLGKSNILVDGKEIGYTDETGVNIEFEKEFNAQRDAIIKEHNIQPGYIVKCKTFDYKLNKKFRLKCNLVPLKKWEHRRLRKLLRKIIKSQLKRNGLERTKRNKMRMANALGLPRMP